MESQNHVRIAQLEERVKYLEGLLDQNKIAYQKDAATQQQDAVKYNYPLQNLDKNLIERYARQMLIPGFGKEGQMKICNAKVLIIGAGGIGAPAAYYLAGAGIGRLGLVDGDRVEETNLHRQIIHSTTKIGMNKTLSAKVALEQLNPNVEIRTYEEHLVPSNAARIIEDYDIVLDASDNALARYLVNDICVLKKKILVSACALRWDAQITVFGIEDGPCYRCLYPECPKPSMMMSCGDGGVVGMVPGLVGILEAIEAVKIIIGEPGVLSKRLLVYDGKTSNCKVMKIRGKQENCEVCGKNPSIKSVEGYDYFGYTGTSSCPTSNSVEIPKENNIGWKVFKQVLDNSAFAEKAVLIDVRPKEQFDLVNVDKAVSIPLRNLTQKSKEEIEAEFGKDKEIYVMCRRGVASKTAAAFLLEKEFKNVYNVEGGITQYRADIDPSIPSI